MNPQTAQQINAPQVGHVHVHRWIGNVCTECGVAHHIAQEQEIADLRTKLERAERIVVLVKEFSNELLPLKDCLCGECTRLRELQNLLTEP